jgi:hypothetical protein
MTGMVDGGHDLLDELGDAMRATPPSARIMAGTRSSAMTATAPASSAMRACATFMTSMMTPPLSISARPVLSRSPAPLLLCVPFPLLVAIMYSFDVGISAIVRRRGSRRAGGRGDGDP